jgi:RND family efflux transporter MFP subunit
MKKRIHFVLIIAALVSCGHAADTKSTEEKVISVKTQKVQSTKSSNSFRYSGTIEASQTIPLTFQTTGIVENIYVETGDPVRKGQLLATVDKSDIQNIYNASLSKYQQAKDAYDRLKTVHDNGSLPEIKWVEMVTNLEQAKSSMELTKNNLEKCYLRAPDNGFIGRRNIEPGQSAIGSSIAPIELVKIETVLVKISVPENEISKLKKDLKAKFTVSALSDKQFEGTITNISPVADAISRTYTAKISVKNNSFELKPGMVCDVKLDLSPGDEMVLVPYTAISTGSDGKPYVFVVSLDQKSVKKQTITTGNYQGQGIEVIGGLALGETIVVEGKEKLSDNSLISL